MNSETRKQARERARAERKAAEAAQARTAQQRRRLKTLGIAVLAAALAVGVMVAISAGGADRDDDSGTIEGGAEVARQLNGIPQDGVTLGDRRARVTLIEFADLQCPFCAQAARDALPEVIDRYVRTGKVKIEFRPLAFIGSDSQVGAQHAAAAAQQDRLWQFVDLFYRNQGDENSGYVTDEFLAGVMRAARLDRARLDAARESARTNAVLNDAQQLADAAGVRSTPTFQLRVGDGRPQPIELTELTADQLIEPIERALGRA